MLDEFSDDLVIDRARVSWSFLSKLDKVSMTNGQFYIMGKDLYLFNPVEDWGGILIRADSYGKPVC